MQTRLEEVLLELAAWLHEATGESRLALAGGVALNCVANSRLWRDSAFDDVWVQPAAGAEAWERVIAVNLVGTAAVVRAALPALRETHGRVVTVASTLGLRALPDATAYCASKFGVVGFTRALAAELGDEVGVTMLVPGGMRTSFFDGREEQYRPPDDARLNDPADVARAVLLAFDLPPGCELRELVVAPAGDGSWPP
jgi:NAD(P)-dependent dehydrogenase (short-subunit alcohol dehydrogenase family)